MDRITQRKRRRRARHRAQIIIVISLILLLLIIAAIVFLPGLLVKNGGQSQGILTPGKVTSSPSSAPTPSPTPTPIPDPTGSADADPGTFGFETEIQVNGTTVPEYNASDADKVYFDPDQPYTNLEGVITFRGSNFRTNPAYGTLSTTPSKLEVAWNVPTGSLPKGEGGDYTGTWTGSGWTGQPILVKWPESTKKIMNMYDSAKAKTGLVEAIYATMDGNIYFIDAETGEATRKKINIGVPFKGAGSLDPRGYPVLYLGSGDNYKTAGKESRAMAISLIDGSVLFTFGKKTDSFALRDWHAYDSSPLVDAKSDTLLYPGENGILYRVKLNTKYDEAAGTLTMTPDAPVKMRYSAKRTREDGYWLGYEGSAVGWRNYLFLTENSGLMQCIDVNTMKPVWVQDIWDDTNATAVFEEDRKNLTAYFICRYDAG